MGLTSGDADARGEVPCVAAQGGGLPSEFGGGELDRKALAERW